MNRFDAFQTNYNEAVENIKSLMASTVDYEQECKHLVTWLIETQHNPYGIFVDDQSASSMGSAEGFAGLSNLIHHAMCDDGDISFPVVNGQPRIAFVWKNEDNIEKYVLTQQEQVWRNEDHPSYTGTRFKKDLKIEFLKDAYEFTKAFDAYELKQLKHYFLSDAARQGVEFATKHYCDKQGFDIAWVDDLPAYQKKYGAWL